MGNITLQDIAMHRQYLSIEQVTATHSESTAVKKLTLMVDTAKEFIKQKLNPLNIFFKSENVIAPQGFIELARKAKYTDLVKFEVAVPEGFSGRYLGYSEALLNANRISESILKDVVIPFNNYAAQLVNQPALLNSVSFQPKVNPKDLKAIKKELGKHFNGRKHITLPFGQVFGNMKEVEAMSEIAYQIALALKVNDVAKMKQAVADLTDTLDHLLNYVNSNSNNQLVKKQTIDKIGDLTLILAEQVEFYAMVNYSTAVYVRVIGLVDQSFNQYQA